MIDGADTGMVNGGNRGGDGTAMVWDDSEDGDCNV
jgi:hypothetical protein